MSISPRWMMVNGVKYQSHDSFWRLGELMLEEIDLEDEEEEDVMTSLWQQPDQFPDQEMVLSHLHLLPTVDWDLPSPVSPRGDTPRSDTPREPGTPNSLLSLVTNVTSPSPREDPDDGFWNTVSNMSLEEMVTYVTGY